MFCDKCSCYHDMMKMNHENLKQTFREKVIIRALAKIADNFNNTFNLDYEEKEKVMEIVKEEMIDLLKDLDCYR